MSGSGGVSMARPARGENRFYVSPAMRKYHQLPQQQQQQQQKAVPPAPRVEPVKKAVVEADPCGSSSSTSSSSNCSVSCHVGKEGTGSGTFGATGCPSFTNLDRFLEYTTPVVPAQIMPKSAKGWRSRETMETQSSTPSFFVLGDLWESFKEWSVYGAGVPVLLNGCDTVVQYYVPYLSGMQLYVDPSRSSLTFPRPGDDSDADSSRSISSDCASDYGSDSGGNDVRGNFRSHTINRDASSDECEVTLKQGQLVFEYLEHASPFTREPLADKALALASQFPQLKTYRSCDLAPSSWISVAWYPIYRIPMGPTLQNLDACFLTFHSLSTPLNGQNLDGTHLRLSARECRSEDLSKLRLPTFGLASYKFKVSFWNPDAYENQKVTSLLQAADNWLKHLHVSHPDYRFFISHGANWR